VDGTMVRRGLSKEYWQNHSADRAPKAERTANGYKLLEGAGDVHDESLYG
jgi:adenylylsulfate kinase-like enzyme